MNGQWLGTYQGASAGTIIVNVDERRTNYQGVAYLLEDDKTLPSSAAFFTTSNKDAKFRFRTEYIAAIDWASSGDTVPWEKIKDRYGVGIGFSRYADVTGAWDENALTLSYVTDTAEKGESVLPRSK